MTGKDCFRTRAMETKRKARGLRRGDGRLTAAAAAEAAAAAAASSRAGKEMGHIQHPEVSHRREVHYADYRLRNPCDVTPLLTLPLAPMPFCWAPERKGGVYAITRGADSISSKGAK